MLSVLFLNNEATAMRVLKPSGSPSALWAQRAVSALTRTVSGLRPHLRAFSSGGERNAEALGRRNGPCVSRVVAATMACSGRLFPRWTLGVGDTDLQASCWPRPPPRRGGLKEVCHRPWGVRQLSGSAEAGARKASRRPQTLPVPRLRVIISRRCRGVLRPHPIVVIDKSAKLWITRHNS